MQAQLGRFGDRRLQREGAFLLERLIEGGAGPARLRSLGGGGLGPRPVKQVGETSVGGDRAGEVQLGRFLRNKRVTPGEMVATALAHTASRVGGRQVVVIQDTTSLRDDGDQCSLHLHPTIAIDAVDGSLIGLVDACFLHRTGGKRESRNSRAFDDKESRRWLDATVRSADLAAAGAAQVTMVADRESDIYEEFALRPAAVDLVIRMQQNRSLADGTLLYDRIAGLAELGRETIEIPAAPGRSARQATLALRACSVAIKRPKQSTAAETARLPASVTLSCVEAREIDPPDGVVAAHWRLLTTHPVVTLADAQEIVRLYRLRWTIEQVFRVMKTKGFDIEASRVAHEKPFENLTLAVLIAAITVMQLVRERDGITARPLVDVFEADEQPALEAISASLEGKTERQKNKHPRGSLAYATWVCARLGGWTGYYGKPGPIVIHTGLTRLRTMLEAWHILRDV